MTSLVVVMMAARGCGSPSTFFCAARRARPPTSPPTPPEMLGLLDSARCFCSAANCAADFTASTFTVVRMAVPVSLPCS